MICSDRRRHVPSVRLALPMLACVLASCAGGTSPPNVFDGHFEGLAKPTDAASACGSQFEAHATITDNRIVYSDPANGRLRGTVGELGVVDTSKGDAQLTGIVRGHSFVGQIVQTRCPVSFSLDSGS